MESYTLFSNFLRSAILTLFTIFPTVMGIFAIVVLVSILYYGMCEIFLPTESETKAALEFQKPPPDWGYQARQERSVRLFAIGGSNTRNIPYPSAIMADFDSKSHPNWTTSFERIGIGAVHAFDMVGRKFQFESWDYSNWPNIILLEFSANIDNWRDDMTDEGVETTVTVIRRKYRVVGLPEPAIMFLELFSVRGLVDYMNYYPNATYNQKIALINAPYSNYTVCGHIGEQICNCTHYLAVRRVAKYHGLPMVSWRELAYNSFIRYYLATNSTFVDNPWEYIYDWVHISIRGGRLLYNTLLRPFLDQVMTPREEPAWNKEKFIASQGPLKRMFPVQERPMDLFTKSDYDAMDSIIRQPSKWVMTKIHEREKLRCSTDPTAPLEMDIIIPKECDAVDTCRLNVVFLHSWNTSYTGHLSCELHLNALLEKIVINSTMNGNGGKIQHTGGVRTTWNTTVKAGKHLMKCDKLDDKLTCLMAYSASCIMEI